MNYKDIKEFNQRCEEHPDHQSGMISYGMISQRLQEEIDELREYIEQRTWIGLTDKDWNRSKHNYDFQKGVDWAESILKEKNI